MRRYWIWVVMVVLFFSGCAYGEKEGITLTEQQNTKYVISYFREKIALPMVDNYNPYIMDYSEDGLFYYVNMEDQYQFYFQPYETSEEAFCIFTLTGGYVRNLRVVKKDDGMHFCVLWMEEKAYIYEYDANGKVCEKLALGEEMDFQGKVPVLLALREGGYLIGVDEKIYWISSGGNANCIVSLKEGVIRNLIELMDESTYVVYEKTAVYPAAMQLALLDYKKGQVKDYRTLANDERIFVFEENGLIFLNGDFACLLGSNEESDERVIDLKKQSILAGQIKGIFGSREEVMIISADPVGETQEVKAYRLTPRKDEAGKDEVWNNESQNDVGKEKLEETYAPDGRRILRVALSSAEQNAWEIEYLAKKYNQDSDDTYIETYFFDGTLEDHLGRGKRPDIVMLHDQADIAPLVERGVLANLLPLYENQDKYSLDDVLPRAREALSVGDGLYAMAKRFELLLCTSDGTENDERGNCTIAEYLRWYDAYLEQNEVQGMGNLDNLFYGVLPNYYDEETGKAYFQSVDFKELMKEYKTLKTKYHVGTGLIYQFTDTAEDFTIRKVAEGPAWLDRLRGNSQLAVSENTLEGLPTIDGNRAVYMRLKLTLAILSDSKDKQEALDFILYTCNNKTIMHGTNGGRVEESINPTQTMARFWVFEKNLREEIWETDKEYAILCGPDGPTDTIYLYLTKERRDMLRNLMDSAVGVTKAQNDIYGMFLEEMDGYLNGNKDLDNCCDILQNRVSLYLAE